MTTMTATALRRVLCGVLLGGTLSAASAVIVPGANSTPDPCSSAGQAKVLAKVSMDVGSYLAEHRQSNEALTRIFHQPPATARVNLQRYFDEHPREAADLRTIQAPLVDWAQRCRPGLPPTERGQPVEVI